jgi:hypothetical protein
VKNEYAPLSPATLLGLIKNRLLVRCHLYEVGELGIPNVEIVLFSNVSGVLASTNKPPKDNFLMINYHESCLSDDLRDMDLAIAKIDKQEVQKRLDSWSQNIRFWPFSKEVVVCEGEGDEIKILEPPISLRMMLHFARLEAALYSKTHSDGEWIMDSDVERVLDRLSALIEAQVENWKRVLVI